MSTIETLKAQVEAARIAAAEHQAVAIETAKLQTELSLLQNTAFQNALVEQRVREETTAKLALLHNTCKSIVDEMPVYSATTKENRKWNPQKRFGFGNHIADLYGLLSGIQYSVQEHRELMLAATGLTPDLIESTLDAFGELTYYSQAYNTIVEGVAGNADLLRERILLVSTSLGLMVDVSKVTQPILNKMEEGAALRAETAKLAQEKAAHLAVQADMLKM